MLAEVSLKYWVAAVSTKYWVAAEVSTKYSRGEPKYGVAAAMSTKYGVAITCPAGAVIVSDVGLELL